MSELTRKDSSWYLSYFELALFNAVYLIKYKSKQLRKTRNVAMIDWLAHIFLYMILNDITRDQFHASVDQQHYTLPVSYGDQGHGFNIFLS
jgi:hypothetical protein